MFAADQYQLLDFGEGRKLERFGAMVLDRPSPAALSVSCQHEALWQTATARFVTADDSQTGCGQRGRWISIAPLPKSWTIEHPPLVFELQPTEFGHVGVFPEQAENWQWIERQIEHLGRHFPNNRPRVLNLFAYTGGGTLAAAAAGAEAVHIDASKGIVAWARRNAALSGLAAAPVRWIVEDARRFVAREQKRGHRYHGIILDPPSYGHGPKREEWQIERDLPDLLATCCKLLDDHTAFMLLTCHSLGIGPAELRAQLATVLDAEPSQIDSRDLVLSSSDGRTLHSGVAARWAKTV